MTDSAPFVTALDRAGYRLTEPRRSLATLVADQDGHFTAADIVAEARSRHLGVGRATVFRRSRSSRSSASSSASTCHRASTPTSAASRSTTIT